MARTDNKEWRVGRRQRPSEYKPRFLHDLRARGQVMEVDEGWKEGSAVPPGIKWVLYPNGDLLHIEAD
jgi:hypothetical protein